MDTMDVFDSGRMAFIQDAQGAIFGAWQPKNHIGYHVQGEPGSVAWVELLTTDSKKAAPFYSSVLGQEAVKAPGPMDYTLLKIGGHEVAGIMDITKEMGPMRPAWMLYFATADIDATARKAKSLGGKVLMEPRDAMGQGRFATLMDPQGAVFSVFQPKHA